MFEPHLEIRVISVGPTLWPKGDGKNLPHHEYDGLYADATSDAPERIRSRYSQMDILWYALFNAPHAITEHVRVLQVERVALVSFDSSRLCAVISRVFIESM